MRKITLNTLLTRSLLVRCVFFIALIVSTNSALAQQFGTTSSYLQTTQIQSAQTAEASYDAYQSTIYEPFSGLTPSSSNGGNNQPSGISGRRNTTIDPGNGDDWGSNSDGGDQENSSPIGEPWIMLAFAAMAAVVITLRKKQTA